MLNEYPRELIDSILKPSRNNRLSSDTIHQGTVIIPNVKGICEEFRLIGNRFNLRIIFRPKYPFCGTLMRTGQVRDAQRTKQSA
jgi:hypothetical protein